MHFLAAGLLFYGLTLIPWHRPGNEIVVSRADVAQIARQYRLQFGALPTAAQLAPLVERHVHDEVLYRQGLALKLDRDDEVVRRRVVQKMQFLTQDMTAPPEPSAAQLQSYYRAHAAHYRSPVRVTFSHIFFSADSSGDKTAEARAKAVLASLSDGTERAPDRGDPFPDLYDYADFGSEQMDRLFGHSQLSTAIFTAPVGHWAGPFRSGYGWHLVHVDRRTPPALPPLAKIRDKVREDYLRAESDAANRRAFLKLKSQYRIVYEDGGKRP